MYMYIFCLLSYLTLGIEAKESMLKTSFQKITQPFSKKKADQLTKEFADIEQIEIYLDQGDVSINSWQQKSCAVTLEKNGSEKQMESTRINLKPHNGILQIATTTTDPKQVAYAKVSLIVPETCSVKIATQYGSIVVKNIKGDSELHTEKGNITLVDGVGNSIIHTKSGSITIQKSSMNDDDKIHATAQKGSITISLPQNITTRLDAHSKKGIITSTVPVLRDEIQTVLNKETYKHQRQNFTGTIAHDVTQSIEKHITLQAQYGVTIKTL